jgi:hypothetical protein
MPIQLPSTTCPTRYMTSTSIAGYVVTGFGTIFIGGPIIGLVALSTVMILDKVLSDDMLNKNNYNGLCLKRVCTCGYYERYKKDMFSKSCIRYCPVHDKYK